ncbi:NAD(P)/FAD-dependent oxidoreductase [Polymorphospora rubra]|uniref:NAD(P)/FAD-dependent oxidoreductase n=1 Tax=Polymorphospora rubra TaxID=338584 RepID=UPI001BB36A4A|nr:FAD-dependent oxidoreductase [Polymorphospora rubra]
MPEQESIDVVVVGNGVIGTSIAYELARRSPETSIVVLGPRHRSGAASMAAGAMLNTFGEITKYTLMSPASQAKFQLCRDALDRWPSWLELLKQESGVADVDKSLSSGTTVLLNAKSGHLDDENYAALLAALAKFDEPHEEIAPGDIPGLDPLAEARPLRAVHLPREGAIDARAVLSALETAATRHGVRFVDGEAAGFDVDSGTVRGVRLVDGTTLSAGTVLLAAGSFSGPLTGVFEEGSVPAMFAGKGIAVQTQRRAGAGFQHVVRTPNRSGSCGLHAIPLGDGVEYLGATNLLFSEPAHTPDIGMSEFLVQVAREQLDHRLFYSDVISWLVGNRPVAIDGFPLIGRTSIDGLLITTGTYRDGFHCSPVLAQLVVDDLLGVGSLADALPHFKPERRPIESMTVEEAVKEFAFHGVSASIEAGLRLPSHTDTTVLEVFYLQVAQRYYEAVQHPIGLSPEVLLSIVFDPDHADHRITRYLNAVHDRYA